MDSLGIVGVVRITKYLLLIQYSYPMVINVYILVFVINETFYLINLLLSLTLFKHSVTSKKFLKWGGAFTILFPAKGALSYISLRTTGPDKQYRLQPTSVEAERIFSSCAYLCNKFRSSLRDKSLDILCLIRNNIK